jgi:hypothetical protein
MQARRTSLSVPHVCLIQINEPLIGCLLREKIHYKQVHIAILE